MPIVAPPVFPVMSTPPSTNDMENFDTRADTFLGELPAVFRPAVIGIGNSAYANALESQVQATVATSYAGIAGTARDQAQAFAQSAVNAPGTSGTSSSLLSIGPGYKYMATQPGKAWVVGQAVVIARTSAPSSQRMYGVIDGYDGNTGAMTVLVSGGDSAGSGAYADWTVSLSATREGVVSQGTGPGQGPNKLSFGWVSPRIRMSVDGFDVGSIATGDDVAEAAPPGLLGLFFHGTPPAGWLKANGAAVSRTTYARLFGVIGTGYGAGDGSTTFNLPDMRGLFPRAQDDGRGIDPGRGIGTYQSSANLSHGHTTTESPHAHGTTEVPHTHGASTSGSGGHDHDSGWVRNSDTGGAGSGDGTGSGVNFIGNIAVNALGVQRKTSSVANHAHGVTVNSSSTGLSVNAAVTGLSVNAAGDTESRPQNLALMACIRF